MNSLSRLAATLSFACIFTSAAPADTVLKGNIGARTIDDDVTISADTSCVFNGTIIKGNVRVLRGARLYSNGAQIDGNVQADGAFLVDLRKNTRVDGDVQGKGTRTIRVGGRTAVEGNVQLTEGSAGRRADALLVKNASVDGDVQAEKSSGRIRILGNRVGGNIQVVENSTGVYQIRRNRTEGDLQFFKNRGKGKIIANTVGGNLQSKENSPRPVVKRNTVEGDLEVE